MKTIMTLFQFVLIDQMKVRDSTKKLYLCCPQKNHTVDLTTTLNSNNYSVHKYDDKKYDLPAWNQSSTDDEENDETEDPFDTAKPYPSLEAKIEIYLSSTIDTVPIFATR